MSRQFAPVLINNLTHNTQLVAYYCDLTYQKAEAEWLRIFLSLNGLPTWWLMSVMKHRNLERTYCQIKHIRKTQLRVICTSQLRGYKHKIPKRFVGFSNSQEIFWNINFKPYTDAQVDYLRRGLLIGVLRSSDPNTTVHNVLRRDPWFDNRTMLTLTLGRDHCYVLPCLSRWTKCVLRLYRCVGGCTSASRRCSCVCEHIICLIRCMSQQRSGGQDKQTFSLRLCAYISRISQWSPLEKKIMYAIY